ncbi:uncharacterized protein LOC129759155 [Uranotaenia lowii]|uniref:uncharacterized protein LOC129759155 n=1 Tax=Uranotaenia lowii TaxID=190385 RepID=UPI002479070E|nr:uncharacterized protein LOC129759155 [Uranotaenia lowii]
MEDLSNIVDGETWRILIDNGFTLASLQITSEKDLEDIGVLKGPRLLIKNFLSKQTSPMPESSNAGRVRREIEATVIREVLEADSNFSNKFYAVLLNELPLDHNTALEMVRILCNHFFKIRMLNNDYPNIKDKMSLADAILEAFPYLEKTRVREDAPKESLFFWKNDGNMKGNHTGLIQRRLDTMRKSVPRENRKFLRAPHPNPLHIQETVLEEVDLVADLPAIRENMREIISMMRNTHEVLEAMRSSKVSPKDIITKFPHFRSFGGAMIQQAYQRIHSNAEKAQPNLALLRTFLSKAQFLGKNFETIEDDYIRACGILLTRMGSRGCKRNWMDRELSINQLTLAPLIRWVDPAQLVSHIQLGFHPHIICLGLAERRGNYLLLVDGGETIECGDSSLQALDTFFKIFDVLNVKIPSLLRSLLDLVQLEVYQTKKATPKPMVLSVLNLYSRAHRAEEGV